MRVKDINKNKFVFIIKNKVFNTYIRVDIEGVVNRGLYSQL